MDSRLFKIGESFKAITRSVFPDRNFSGPRPENGGVDLTKSYLLSEFYDFRKLMAPNGRWVFGSVLQCTKLVVAVLKIRVSVVRFRDWPPSIPLNSQGKNAKPHRLAFSITET
ncbi:MAG: hypothetical protein PHV02_10975 [Rhodocyclaceae bacterium]|nr:hypothetical protein [Rhodocyclaceae bacterium]